MIARLVAFLLVMSIYPVIVDFSEHKANYLWLAFSQTAALSGFHFFNALHKKSLQRSLRQVLSAQKRWPFFMLVLFGVGAAIFSVKSFQGSEGEFVEVAGASSAAILVDIVATLLLGGFASYLIERQELELSIPRINWTIAALVFVFLFISLDKINNQLSISWQNIWRIETAFALLWAFCGVVIMQLTRTYFSGDNSVEMNGFLAWRYLPPTLVLGVILVLEPQGPTLQDSLPTMIALGTALVLAVRLQYRLLEYAQGTVIKIASAMLLVPPITYLASVALGRSQMSFEALGFSLAIMFCLALAKMRAKAKFLDFRNFFRKASLQGIRWWRGPATKQMGTIIGFVLLSFSLCVLIYLPVFLTFQSSRRELPLWAALGLIGFTVVTLTFAYMTREFQRLTKSAAIERENFVLRNLHDNARFNIHMIKNLLLKVSRPECQNQQQLVRFAYGRLEYSLAGTGGALQSCELDWEESNVQLWLQSNLDFLQELCNLRHGRLVLEAHGIPAETTWRLDSLRMQQIFFELVDNTQKAWQGNSRFDGLEIIVTAVLKDEHVQIRYNDNGPGITGPLVFGVGLRACQHIISTHQSSAAAPGFQINRATSKGFEASFQLPVLNSRQ
jgi:signal transduction histidine kinase